MLFCARKQLVTGARPSGATRAGARREALCADQEEGLPGGGSDCRSGTAAGNTFCADEEREAAGSVGDASRAGAFGDAPDGSGQRTGFVTTRALLPGA